MKNKIIIGSRGSDLALWQANFVLAELKKIKIDAEIKIIKTQGDKIQDLSFDKLEEIKLIRNPLFLIFCNMKLASVGILGEISIILLA